MADRQPRRQATKTPPRRTRAGHLEPRHQRLVQALQQHGRGLTLDELAGSVGKTPKSVMSDLSQMRQAGVPIETIFQYGATRYRVASDEPLTPAQTIALQLTMHLDELTDAEVAVITEAIERTMAARQSRAAAHVERSPVLTEAMARTMAAQQSTHDDQA